LKELINNARWFKDGFISFMIRDSLKILKYDEEDERNNK